MHSPQRVILDKTAIIRQFGLFADLSKGQINLIARASEFYLYSKGEIIYNEGDPADALYCLISGRVRLFTKDRAGQTTTLECLCRGAYFGVISLLTQDPHSVSVEVANDAIVLKIPKANFDKILKEIPNLAIHFSSTLSRRLKRRDFGQKTVFESTIVSVYGIENKIGSSRYAMGLATALGRETKKEIIYLDMTQKAEAGPALNGVFFDEAQVKKRILKRDNGISLLAVPIQTRARPNRVQLISLLSCLTNLFDYCIVDLPSKVDEFVLTVLVQSNLIHIVTDNQTKNVNLVNNLVEELKVKIQDYEEKLKVIVNELRGRLEQPQLLSLKVYATLPDSKTEGYEYDLAVRRIARQTGEVLVGLALGSGAALGLSQIGVIKVLEREGIPIDVVAGSSMGALIGAFWAVGLRGVDMERIAIENKRRLGIFSLKDLTFPIKGLISDAKTLYFLKRYLGDRTFYDIRFTLKIVAASLEDRKKIILDSGDLVSAVRSSISIPGIYLPVKTKGGFLIDGGIIEPVPVSILSRMKVKKIIAVNTLPSPEDMEGSLVMEGHRRAKEAAALLEKGLFERFLVRLKDRFLGYFTPSILDIIVNSIQALEYSMAEASSKQADVAIHPDLAGCSWKDFLKPELLIALGEEACIKALPEIKRLTAE